jgi:hypothetical protein
MMLVRIIGFMVIVSFVSIITFWPLVERVGDAPTQKSLYVANDMSMLMRAVSSLPEDANIVYNEFFTGTAKIESETLFIETIYEEPARIRHPEFIDVSSDEVPISFSYITKTGNLVSLSGNSLNTCSRTGADLNTKFSFTSDQRDSSAAAIAQATELLGKSRIQLRGGDDIIINFITSDVSQITFNEVGSRDSNAMSCFLQKTTGFERFNINDANNPRTVNIYIATTENPDSVSTKTFEAIKQFLGEVQ